MAQQARSEATRWKILNAAVDLFGDVGYTSIGLGDVIERAALTKGALYYHFDSKESLAEAIIAEASARVWNAVDAINHGPIPGMEKVIRSSFVIAGIVTGDPLARTGAQLMRALGEFNETATQTYTGMQMLITELVKQAGAEGDLSADVDPEVVGELLIATYLGAELLSIGTSTNDLVGRLQRAWSLLLPAIVDDAALPYFREFLQREALRAPGPRADG